MGMAMSMLDCTGLNRGGAHAGTSAVICPKCPTCNNIYRYNVQVGGHHQNLLSLPVDSGPFQTVVNDGP